MIISPFKFKSKDFLPCSINVMMTVHHDYSLYQCNFLLVVVFERLWIYLVFFPEPLLCSRLPVGSSRALFSLKRNTNLIFFLLKCLCRSLFALNSKRHLLSVLNVHYKSFCAPKSESVDILVTSLSCFRAPPAQTADIFCCTLWQ